MKKVPEKYFVVSNDDYVRVKYVLVYDKLKHVRGQHSSWLMRHKFMLVILLYVILLLVLSLLQSKPLKQLLSYRQL